MAEYVPAPKCFKRTDGRWIVGFDKLSLDAQIKLGYIPVEKNVETIREQKLQELDASIRAYIDQHANTHVLMNMMGEALMAGLGGKAIPQKCLDFYAWKSTVEAHFVKVQDEIRAAEDPGGIDASVVMFEKLFDASAPDVSTKDLIAAKESM